jgi:membrane-associated PAP2 superfamily phosphatase
MWKQWVNAILGLAVIATPFLALSTTAVVWTLVIAGAVIAILSIWSAMESPSEYTEYRVQHSH